MPGFLSTSPGTERTSSSSGSISLSVSAVACRMPLTLWRPLLECHLNAVSAAVLPVADRHQWGTPSQGNRRAECPSSGDPAAGHRSPTCRCSGLRCRSPPRKTRPRHNSWMPPVRSPPRSAPSPKRWRIVGTSASTWASTKSMRAGPEKVAPASTAASSFRPSSPNPQSRLAMTETGLHITDPIGMGEGQPMTRRPSRPAAVAHKTQR